MVEHRRLSYKYLNIDMRDCYYEVYISSTDELIEDGLFKVGFFSCGNTKLGLYRWIRGWIRDEFTELFAMDDTRRVFERGE